MNLNGRVAKIEAASIKAQIKRLTKNIAKVPDAQILSLWDLMRDEAIRRKLVDPSEIGVTKEFYQDLLADGLTKDEAAEMTLQAAKANGFNIKIEDFI